MTSQGLLYIDGDPEGKYLETIILPPNWGMVHNRERQGLGPVMNWAFQAFHDEASYGWLADDLRPRTQGFDKKLEEAAGAWNFACSADGWYSLDPALVELLMRGHDMAGALCWGGDLVRAAGQWAWLHHVGIDTAWCLVNSRLGNAKYCPDVTVEHLNFKTKKRPQDATDDITVPDTDLYKGGVRELKEFFQGGGMVAMVEKIRAKRDKALAINEPWWAKEDA